MADISRLARVIDGYSKNVDLTTNTPVVLSIKVGGVSNTELTKTILDNLVTLQNGSDILAAVHHHDGRYYTESELGAQTNGASGASKIGIDVTPAFSNFTSGSNVQSALEGIDAALGTTGSTDFADNIFRISDNSDPSKKIAFEASGIAVSTVRTITMPNFDVNLGSLTNANISASAAIVYSKLDLALSIMNSDINASAAIDYSKLALTDSIFDSDINATAGISYSKLALTNSILNADINASAGIVYSKLSLTNSILNADIGASAAIVYTKLDLADGIVNADINTAAAIAYSKLSLSNSILNADINASAGIVYSKLSLTNSILNADIGASAAIVYTKLDLADGIVNADINTAAAIAYSKLSLSNSILNADINASAAIAHNKLAALTANRVVITDGSGFISASTVTTTILGYLDATSSIQTQLNAKAHTSLNNLASTALNTSIIPAVDGFPNLGSTTLAFGAVFSGAYYGNTTTRSSIDMTLGDFKASSNEGVVHIHSNDLTAPQVIFIRTNLDGVNAGVNSGAILIATSDVTTTGGSGAIDIGTGEAESVGSGAVTIYTGGATSGTSGDINLTVGTPSSGIRGSINLSARQLDASNISQGKAVSIWKKYTVTHTALQAAALTNNIELLSLPIAGVIKGVVIKHTTAFAGTGILSYTVSVGIASALTKYASAFDVFQATGAGVGQSSNVMDFESFTGATSIKIAATSTGANLDQSTAGSVDIYVLWGILP